MQIFSTITERIECLKLEAASAKILLNNFPVLRRLDLRIKGFQVAPLRGGMRNNFLDISRFPQLREFHWTWDETSFDGLSPHLQRLPPLQVLSIDLFAHRGHLIITQCANTLVSLSLSIFESTENRGDQLDLPHLRQLLIAESDVETKKRLQISAPHLHSIFHGVHSGIGHAELELQHPLAIRKIYLWKASMNLASYPGLRSLLIQADGSTPEVVKVTMEGIKYCPDLSLIRYGCDYHVDEDVIAEKNIRAVIMNTIEASGHAATIEKFSPYVFPRPGSLTCSVCTLRAKENVND
ncbi:hypothetical protein M408DRAFT_29591 [Serendipita vermifera MAFF 305830]|uniref:F-box domain-containing protein n=1 Tax=Serendipita vermifera MAFF 305830 TaxID=933852 RepID=A0A0C2WVG7_SERVB|nr:hypothetical protein M408DRAFT_29591 [Serendipita vermifera MAFF 305830]